MYETLSEALSTKLNNVIERVECIDKKLETGFVSSGSMDGHKSYVNVLKESSKPAVIIKPKTAKQNSKTTIHDITSHVNYKNIEACGLRSVNGGGVVINCQSNASTMKVKQIIEDNFGDKYEVSMPKLFKPRFKIVNAMNNIDERHIINVLITQNEWLDSNDSIELKKVINKTDSESNDIIDIILEVDAFTSKKIIEHGKVNLGFRRCNIVQHVHIKRCFKCCGFGHMAKDCTNKLACAKCGGEHKRAECRAKNTQCINCKINAKKYALKMDTNHHAWSFKCEILQKRISQLNRKFLDVKE